MSCLLITGGAGFIGSNFVRQTLARADRPVVVLDALTYAGNRRTLEDVAGDERFTFVEGDIGDAPLVDRLLREYRPEALINFAAETHVDRSIDSPWNFVETNIVGTFHLLDASRRHLASLREPERSRFRFLHVSTDEVYGSLGDEGRFTESTPYAPNSPYAASKASADHLVRSYHETFELPTVITNCSNNYGPFQFPEKLIPLMTLNALEGRPLPIYGDGGNVRDWLYVDDHCEGIRLALDRGRPGESYNLGGDAEKTNLEIVEVICATLERLHPAAKNSRITDQGLSDYRQLKQFVTDRPGHDRRYAIDASKAHEELGWRPRHDFDSGIEKTLRWFLDHRSWCAAVQSEAEYGRERLGAAE